MSASCKRTPLAHTSVCQVDLCSCGVVHLAIGVLTLRLEPEALKSLCQAIQTASTRLSAATGCRFELLQGGADHPEFCESKDSDEESNRW